MYAEDGRQVLRSQHVLRGALGSDAAVQADDVAGVVRDSRKVMTNHELRKATVATKPLEQFAEQ